MDMHRFHRQAEALAALLCAFSLLLGGCGGEKQAASDGATEKRIVKDIKGHEVEPRKEL